MGLPDTVDPRTDEAFSNPETHEAHSRTDEPPILVCETDGVAVAVGDKTMDEWIRYDGPTPSV